MDIQVFQKEAAKLGQSLQQGIALREHTTYRVGGPAKLWAEPSSENQVQELLTLCHTLQMPHVMLGNGSNVIAPDNGFAGLVIKLGKLYSSINRLDDNRLYAQSGALLEQLSEAAKQHHRCGLEWMYDIPGSVGGAVLMNASNSDGEMSGVVQSVRFIDRSNNIVELPVEELGLGYRQSRFKASGEVILGATFVLGAQDNPEEIKQRMIQVRRGRWKKFPMEFGNGGSVFKRPPGHYAGKLIEDCGLKGLRVGDAEVSVKHAGFIINRGGATADDILGLIKTVAARVLEQTGVQLEMEQIPLQVHPAHIDPGHVDPTHIDPPTK